MNIRADIAVSDVVVPLPIVPARRLAEGFLAAVTDRATALFFDEAPGPDARRRLGVEADGTAIAGPLVSTAVPLRSGGRRHVVLLGHRADWLLRRRLLLTLDRAPRAVLDPAWLQSPRVDVAALFEGLTDEGRQRLLRLLLTTGASLLGRGAPAGFAEAARALLALLGVRHLDPLGWTRLGAATRIVSYRAPRDLDPARLGELVTLVGGAMSRLAGEPLTVERRDGGTLLHVCVAGTVVEGTTIVAAGAMPLALRLPAPEAAAVPLDRWLLARDGATRAWAEGLLAAAAATDATAAAIARELRHRADPAPALAVGHLSGTPSGVLYALRLDDPHGLVREARLVRGEATATLPVTGAPIAGYAALPRASLLDDRVRLVLAFHSGRTATVVDDRVAAFAGPAPAAIAPEAVAAARLDRERSGRLLRIESFGAALPEPRLTIVCPVGACLDAIRTRAALVAGEREGAATELVYHAAEGPEAAAARTLLATVAATFGVAHRLLVVTPDLDPADRIVAATRAGAAPAVLVLGADVLPAEPGWLAPWRRLSRRHPMLRAAVAGHDGRREGEAADCLGFFREAALAPLEAATRYGAPAVLAAQVAETFGRHGTPEARLGLVFTRFGEASVTIAEKTVDDAALALILKRSFSIGCDQRLP